MSARTPHTPRPNRADLVGPRAAVRGWVDSVLATYPPDERDALLDGRLDAPPDSAAARTLPPRPAIDLERLGWQELTDVDTGAPSSRDVPAVREGLTRWLQGG